MHELIINLHMHTRYSDGGGSHQEIAQAALDCGLDAVIVTDHNILLKNFEGYVSRGDRKALILIGEEIHDQERDPQKNHLLVFGTDEELATFAKDPQRLINAVHRAGGLSFVAHPDDPAAPAFHETDISWVDWSVKGLTGLELWNGLSEFKTVIPSLIHGLFYAYFPQFIARGPLEETLKKWDSLLVSDRTVAVGGSDAHALLHHLGPLSRVIFPYQFHFRGINTHVLIPHKLTGDLIPDKRALLLALAAGHCFIGYDLPAPTRGFSFTAQGRETSVIMGDEIPASGGITLQARLPSNAKIRLIKDGRLLKEVVHQQICTHITNEPGVYRIEAYRNYLGRERGWIFSNPIYAR